MTARSASSAPFAAASAAQASAAPSTSDASQYEVTRKKSGVLVGRQLAPAAAASGAVAGGAGASTAANVDTSGGGAVPPVEAAARRRLASDAASGGGGMGSLGAGLRPYDGPAPEMTDASFTTASLSARYRRPKLTAAAASAAASVTSTAAAPAMAAADAVPMAAGGFMETVVGSSDPWQGFEGLNDQKEVRSAARSTVHQACACAAPGPGGP